MGVRTPPTSSGHVVRLERAPAVGPLYLRAALDAVRAGHATIPGPLPGTEVRRGGVAVDLGRLAEYCRVCGFGLRDTLPPTYPHVLAFPLQLVLMADRAFPLRLPGLVHLRNRIVVHRPIRLGEVLDIAVRAERLAGHPKGAQVDLVAEIGVAGERVWSGRSTYLARGVPGGGVGTPPVPAEEDGPEPAPGDRVAAVWRVPADAGRRYAAVSGDVNPIHLTPPAAKAFGFPRAIAHGMWTAARALAALAGRSPDVLVYDAAFRRPVLLPSTVELWTAPAGEGWDLAVRSRRREGSRADHLLATVRPLPMR